jgi:hypothetical protein
MATDDGNPNTIRLVIVREAVAWSEDDLEDSITDVLSTHYEPLIWGDDIVIFDHNIVMVMVPN